MFRKIFSFVLFYLVFFVTAFAASNELQKINQLQLQEENQRFFGRFYARIADAVSHDKDFTPQTNTQLLTQLLIYNAEALKIVTSPYPVINYLDMLVFIKLCKFSLIDHWIPKVYGRKGYRLLRAFQESERDLENVSRKFVKSADLSKIDRLARNWRRTHRGDFRVERVRFSDFSSLAGMKQDTGFDFSLSHFLVDTESAVEKVDEVLLASNRAMFLAQNIPGIMRYQMRLGFQEMLIDTTTSLEKSSALTRELEKTRPVIEELTTLVRSSDTAVKDMKSLVAQLPKHTKFTNKDITKNLSQLDSIVTKSNDLLSTLLVKTQGKQDKLQKMKDEVYKMIFTFFGILILSVLVIIAGWWTGKYIYETKVHKRSGQL